MSSLRTACCQIAISVDDPAMAREAAGRAVAEASSAGARLIVLPELANSGYCFVDRDEATRLAETADGPWVILLKELSEKFGCVIVSGFAERGSTGQIYSSAVIVDRGAVLGIYRKTHLWDTEHNYFTPGDQPALVLDTSAGRVATAVCYDIEFPETVRVAAEAGAEILAAPVNWPLLPKPEGQWPIEIAKAQAAASSYRLPIAVADRCGEERGVRWSGGSVIVGADGYLIVDPYGLGDPSPPARLVADVPLQSGTRLGPFNDVFTDRREALYQFIPNQYSK